MNAEQFETSDLSSLRQNNRHEYIGVATYRKFILSTLAASTVAPVGTRPASPGVMSKDELLRAAELHFGHLFGQVDLKLLKGVRGTRLPRWKRTLAWAKVQLQRANEPDCVVQRGKWLTLIDRSLTDPAWIQFALARKRRRTPPRIRRKKLKAKPRDIP